MFLDLLVASQWAEEEQRWGARHRARSGLGRIHRRPGGAAACDEERSEGWRARGEGSRTLHAAPVFGEHFIVHLCECQCECVALHSTVHLCKCGRQYAGEAVVKRLQDVRYRITDTSTLENLGKQELPDPLV